MTDGFEWPTFEDILEYMDPDWASRWHGDVEKAAEFYRTYNYPAWLEAVRDLRDGR